MIEIKNIHKAFGDHQVINGVTAEFHPGITNLIIGGSGSGKTVLLKCMVGLHEPDQGNVLYNGRDFTRMNFEERIAIRKEINQVESFLGATTCVAHNLWFCNEVLCELPAADLVYHRGLLPKSINPVPPFAPQTSGNLESCLALAAKNC